MNQERGIATRGKAGVISFFLNIRDTPEYRVWDRTAPMVVRIPGPFCRCDHVCGNCEMGQTWSIWEGKDWWRGKKGRRRAWSWEETAQEALRLGRFIEDEAIAEGGVLKYRW